MADLQDTVVGLHDTIVGLQDTMVDLQETMVGLQKISQKYTTVFHRYYESRLPNSDFFPWNYAKISEQ